MKSNLFGYSDLICRLMRAMLFVACLLVATVASAGEPWFARVLTGMEVGPTGAQFGHSDPADTRYCAHFDGGEIVRHAVAAKSEYLVMWVRDGDYAYYNSTLLPKAPGLGSRDPLREVMDEARGHQLPVIAYCVVQQGGHFLKAHPEWEMRGADGKPLGRFCFNSGYLEAMKQLVSEQWAYGIAGFHIDMLDQGFGPPYGCWCESCQTQFEKAYGHRMPEGVTWDEAWGRMLEFRYRSSENFEKALAAHIRSLGPNATVDFNYHGNPPFSFEVGQRPVQHAGNGDFITGETGVWGFSALTVGLNAEFYRAAVPGQRVQVAMQRGVRMYHDQTTRPLHDLRWELFTLLAHDAFVTMVDKTAFDGRLDPVAYERVGQAFAEAGAKRHHFGHQPVQDVGLYFSSRTRDWVGRDKPADYFQSFQGAHKALVYEHIPYGIVLDENVTLEGLRRFPVVLLSNVGILSAAELDLLRRYVEAGGNLVVTGLSGCWDGLGKPSNRTVLEPLIGARFLHPLESLDNWVRFSRLDLESLKVEPTSLRPDWPFLVKGPAGVFTPTTAKALGTLWKPHRTTRQREGTESTEWPMSADEPVGPAVLLNQVGEGQVLTFTCGPDSAVASEHHMVEARRLLVAGIRLLHSRPRVRIEAPATVEAVITDDPDARTLRIHLLGYHAPPQTTPPRERPHVLPAMIEDRPVFRSVIELQEPPAMVEALNSTTQVSTQGTRIEAIVDDVHEVLVVHY